MPIIPTFRKIKMGGLTRFEAQLGPYITGQPGTPYLTAKQKYKFYVWPGMLVQICNPALRNEGSKFKASLVYTVRPCLRSK